MDRFDEMKVFADIVALGSFSAAARARSLTPSGVSKCILRLENRIGMLLFKRDTRQVVLTDEGKEYFEGVQRVGSGSVCRLSLAAASEQPHSYLPGLPRGQGGGRAWAVEQAADADATDRIDTGRDARVNEGVLGCERLTCGGDQLACSSPAIQPHRIPRFASHE